MSIQLERIVGRWSTGKVSLQLCCVHMCFADLIIDAEVDFHAETSVPGLAME